MLLYNPDSPKFKLEWVNSDHISNFSYQAEFFGVEVCIQPLNLVFYF